MGWLGLLGLPQRAQGIHPELRPDARPLAVVLLTGGVAVPPGPGPVGGQPQRNAPDPVHVRDDQAAVLIDPVGLVGEDEAVGPLSELRAEIIEEHLFDPQARVLVHVDEHLLDGLVHHVLEVELSEEGTDAFRLRDAVEDDAQDQVALLVGEPVLFQDHQVGIPDDQEVGLDRVNPEVRLPISDDVDLAAFQLLIAHRDEQLLQIVVELMDDIVARHRHLPVLGLRAVLVDDPVQGPVQPGDVLFPRGSGGGLIGCHELLQSHRSGGLLGIRCHRYGLLLVVDVFTV